MNIILTGFMGTGKTAVGKLLAKKLGYKYIDTDYLIEKKENKRISEIFAAYGEPYFRDLETGIVKEVGKLDRHVIATGGGIVLRSENMVLLQKNGIIINLSANADTVYERIKATDERPLLNKPDPRKEIINLLKARESFYVKCDFRVNTDGCIIGEVTDKCLDYIEKKL
ncbi:unnamed protein product [marine sediment metagenome]|uniref:shikimate kinase n=1 Tax=marine sediment metagenome TaxID=412755 RepID=X0TZ21_9ZZZZ